MEETNKSYDTITSTSPLMFIAPSVPKIDFYDVHGRLTGTLTVDDDGLRFEGNAHESARAFFDEILKPMVDAYLQARLGL